MGTLAQFARVCKSWTLRALGRQTCDYDAKAVLILEDLAAALRTTGSSAAVEAAAALEAAACTQSSGNAAAALLEAVQAQPCAIAAAVLARPHILQQLLDAAFCSDANSFATAAAYVLLLLTAGHSRLAGKAPAVVSLQAVPEASAAACEVAAEACTETATAAVTEAVPCCCKAAAQLLELLCEHVQLLVGAIECCQSCSSTPGLLLSRMAAAAPNEALAGQLLQLVVSSAASSSTCRNSSSKGAGLPQPHRLCELIV
jgi:hypothetical protein